MIVYKLGASGPEVETIQRRLARLKYYRGPIDGIFGGGTDSAVRAFQRAKGLEVDGEVGPKMWKALFRKRIPAPKILTKALNYKCLALTGSFETGRGIPDCFAGVSGDFDGQGMSFGVLQWNFGQDSLQPLLRRMMDEHPDLVEEAFGEHYNVLLTALKSGKQKLMIFARSIQDPVRHFIKEPWRGMFKSLGRVAELQDIQVKHAGELYKSALQLSRGYQLWSERAVALMFDIKVQNGSIGKLVKTQILQEFKNLPRDIPEDKLEVQRMRIVANRRAEASNARWIEDVRARKLCCANGRGMVHGIEYDLKGQFGIRLERHEVDQ